MFSKTAEFKVGEQQDPEQQGAVDMDELEKLKTLWKRVLAEAYSIGDRQSTKLLQVGDKKKYFRVIKMLNRKNESGLQELHYIGLDEELEPYDVTEKYMFAAHKDNAQFQGVKVEVSAVKVNAKTVGLDPTKIMQMIDSAIKGAI